MMMMDPDTNKRSVEHQPSETAMATATMRALAAHDEREEIRGRDYLAEIFLTEDRKRPLKDPAGQGLGDEEQDHSRRVRVHACPHSLL